MGGSRSEDALNKIALLPLKIVAMTMLGLIAETCHRLAQTLIIYYCWNSLCDRGIEDMPQQSSRSAEAGVAALVRRWAQVGDALAEPMRDARCVEPAVAPALLRTAGESCSRVRPRTWFIGCEKKVQRCRHA